MNHKLRFMLLILGVRLSLVDRVEARQHYPPPKQIPTLTHEDISTPFCPIQGTERTAAAARPASSPKAKRRDDTTNYGEVSTINSLCGFIEYNLHWPLYCPQNFYCVTSAQYMPCCQNTYSGNDYYSWVDSWTTTLRNTATLSTTVTMTETIPVLQYANCTSYGPCYDSTAAGNCTGSCTSTAIVCDNPYFPYCASIVPQYSTNVSTFFCDTAAYGLTLYGYGHWPMTTATSSSIYIDTSSSSTSTSTSSTFTPTVVPYTQHQPSRPQSVMQGGGALRTASSATVTSGADKSSLHYYSPARFSIRSLLTFLISAATAFTAIQ